MKNNNNTKGNDLVNTILLSMFFMKSVPSKRKTEATKQLSILKLA